MAKKSDKAELEANVDKEVTEEETEDEKIVDEAEARNDASTEKVSAETVTPTVTEAKPAEIKTIQAVDTPTVNAVPDTPTVPAVPEVPEVPEVHTVTEAPTLAQALNIIADESKVKQTVVIDKPGVVAKPSPAAEITIGVDLAGDEDHTAYATPADVYPGDGPVSAGQKVRIIGLTKPYKTDADPFGGRALCGMVTLVDTVWSRGRLRVKIANGDIVWVNGSDLDVPGDAWNGSSSAN